MTTIVCFSDGEGSIDLEPPDHAVLITGQTVSGPDGEGDVTVTIDYVDVDI